MSQEVSRCIVPQEFLVASQGVRHRLMTEVEGSKGRKEDEGNEGVGEMVRRDRKTYGERSQCSDATHAPAS